jgi:LysM repeat protein
VPKVKLCDQDWLITLGTLVHLRHFKHFFIFIFAGNKLDMRLGFTFLLTAIILGFSSCKAYKPVVSTTGSNLSSQDYINNYKDLAVSEMKRTGVPASITLAQGMIESDYGRSRLAVEGNNHFGIKCHNDWKGPTMIHHDDKRNECFRKYMRPEESYYDHSDFLKTGSRYKFLFDLDVTDYKGWARGLRKAGYATNPDYANMLIRKIEENSLMALDQGRRIDNPDRVSMNSVNQSVVQPDNDLAQPPVMNQNINNAVVARVPRVMENNRIQYIIVKDGETRDKIEKEFQLLKWELARYNELNDEFLPTPGQILYLQPKREKAEPGKDFHTTIEGDTMYLISQKYGIKLKSLYELNRMEEGTEPGPGKRLWLRNIKPVN